MRRWFDRLPIHRKLVASALLITAVALGIATAGLGAFDIWRHRATAEDDARALAQVLAENTAAAVLFGDVPAAEELLRSVRARTVVTRACLYLPGGQLFAGFSATGLACPGRDVDDTWGGVSGGADVVRDGRVLGTVVVERSLSDLRGRLLATAAGGALMFVVAAWSAYLLAQRVNARISRPITSLAAYARRFGADVDLAPPRIAAGPDELGDLVVAFDGMVGRIRGATEALRRETAEREAALAQVREAEHRFRTLSDGSPVLLWVNGLAGCEFVNRAYLDFVGLADDAEVRGFDWSKFVHPDDRDDYLATYQRAFDARAPFQAEFRFRRTNGAWRWMRSEATPRFEDGGFAGYVGATVDITERRVAEDALREADQRKDAFLAILAHELRNPLAPIRTGLELLKMDEGGPTVARIRPMLERQVAHMVRLIDDLLDVSRITSGKIHLQRQPTALADLVHAAVEANRAAIDGAGLTLAVRLPEAPCTLDVDPTRFVQVLSNLLHNATKFTDRGGRIEVEARFEARLGECDARPWLMLAVRDTGIGLDPATLPRVFEFFVQGDSRRRPLSGLGIGLGLARQLVEMHGGCITVASEGPGRGSTFTVAMPVLEVSDIPLIPAGGKPRTRIDRRVLVIDDNVDAADTLAALVRAFGAEVATAYDGRAGLARAASFAPDVVLLDIGMPELDGYEACRQLRATHVGARAFIVAITGWGQLHDRERAIAAGFDAHLTKPADPRTLAALLANAPLET
jgi:PAS domain S-box-containing protein